MQTFGSESLSFYLVCKNVKIKTYKTIILSVILYGPNLVSHEIRTRMEVVYKHAEKEKILTKQKGNNTELEI